MASWLNSIFGTSSNDATSTTNFTIPSIEENEEENTLEKVDTKEETTPNISVKNSDNSSNEDNSINDETDSLTRNRSQSDKTKSIAKLAISPSKKTDDSIPKSPKEEKSRSRAGSTVTSPRGGFFSKFLNGKSQKTDESDPDNLKKSGRHSLFSSSKSKTFEKHQRNKYASATDFPVSSSSKHDKNPEKPLKTESNFFAKKAANNYANSTIGVTSEQTQDFKIEKEVQNLSSWIGLHVTPLIYTSYAHNFQDQINFFQTLVKKEKSLKSKLETLTKLKKIYSISKSYLEYLLKLNRISNLKLNKAKKDYEFLYNLKGQIRNISNCFLCKNLEEATQILDQDETLKEFKKSIKNCDDWENLQEIFKMHLLHLKRICIAFSCDEEKTRITDSLKEANSYVENIIDYEEEYIEREESKLKKSLQELQSRQNAAQDFAHTFTTPDHRLEAKKHLTNGTLPKKPKVAGSKAHLNFEIIIADMAQQALSLKGPLGETNDAYELKSGSGGVYLIYDKPPTDNTRKPIFVFKPFNEAPGMPGNKKGNTPDELNVCMDRVLDSTRKAFPISEGIFREYALALIYPKGEPCKTLTSLKLSSRSDEYKCGLLMEYIPHIYSIRELEDATKQAIVLAELDENQTQIDALQKNDSIVDAKEKTDSMTRLTNTRQGLKSKLPALHVNENKSDAQKKAIELCKGWEDVSKKSKMPIWKLIKMSSIRKLLRYTFQIPDFDRNPDNILIAENKKNKDKLYRLVAIDADQILPDTWQSFNNPVWLDTEVGDIILADDEFLCEAIKKFNAKDMLSNLTANGISFQDNPKEIFDIENQETTVVGGEVYNILNAFHVVAKIGLANKNTANQVGRLLFGKGGNAVSKTSRLHELYDEAKEIVKAKLAAESKTDADATENKEDAAATDYQNLINTELYKECFHSIVYSAEDRLLWKQFEVLVLEDLNRKKIKDQLTQKVEEK